MSTTTSVTPPRAPSLLAEERLLVAAGKLARDAGDEGSAVAAVRDRGFSWARALELAATHRVKPLLARSIEDVPGLRDLAPPDVRRALGRARLQAATRAERVAAALAPVLTELEAAGVPVVLLKGAALLATIQPPGTRSLGDVDLLVRRPDYARVAAALVAHGFEKRLEPGRTERALLADHHEIAFVRRGKGEPVDIDLHWRLYPRDRAFSIPTGDLIARARPVRFGGAPALALSPEDAVVHYATQIGIDFLLLSFGRAADIHALVASGSVDWGRLCRIARDAGAAGVTHLALSLAAGLGAEVPGFVFARLETASPGCGTASAVLADGRLAFRRLVVRSAAKVLLMPLLYDRLRNRLAALLTLPLPSYGSAANVQILRPGDPSRPGAGGGLGACLRRARVLVLAAACGVALVAFAGARTLGRRGLAARIREAFWRPANGE